MSSYDKNLVLWLDLETNHNDVFTNEIMEIYIQYADWFQCESEPLEEFYSLIIPAQSQQSSFDSKTEFVKSLDLSTWCSHVFEVNGLLDEMYNVVDKTDKSVECVKKNLGEWLEYLTLKYKLNSIVFAGKNIHYDMTVINRVFGDVLKRYPIAKHTYDISTLYYIHKASGEDLSNSLAIHRAQSDVISTRFMNSILLKILVKN